MAIREVDYLLKENIQIVYSECYIYDREEFEYGKIITYDANTSTKSGILVENFFGIKWGSEIMRKHQTAYDAIKKEIINPLRRKHKQDYLCLRNATIAYFRANGDFDINHYKDVIIGEYQPFDDSLDINKLKDKIGKLPNKHKFDNTFQKTPRVVTDKFKDVIPLTNEIELN